MIKFCAKIDEGDRVIVGTNVLLEVYSSVGPNDFAIGIDTCLGEEYLNCSGVSFAMGNLKVLWEQHIKNFGFARVDF
jgi:hypothetical protein